jgi:hypothetical protein
MYCTEKCLVADKKEIHSDYCGCLAIEYHNQVLYTRRMIFRACSIFRDEEKKFVDLIENKKLPKRFVSEFDFSNCRVPFFNKNMMLSALGGRICSENRKYQYILINTDDQLRFERELSFRFSGLLDLVAPFNLWTSKRIDGSAPIGGILNRGYTNTVGWTFHPFSLLFNTNCHPNVYMTRFGEHGVTAWIVAYPVKSGEQLFLQYRPDNSWQIKSQEERQKLWMRDYRFKCDCVACVNDWKLTETKDYEDRFEFCPRFTSNRIDALYNFMENNAIINEHYERDFPSCKLC